MAAFFALCVHALIVSMHIAIAAFAALPRHGCAAVTAKELRRQQIFLVRLACCRGMSVPFNAFLGSVKGCFVNQRRKCVLTDDIRVTILAQICAIGKYRCNGGIAELSAIIRCNASRIQVLCDTLRIVSVCVAGKNFAYIRRGCRVWFVVLRPVLFTCELIPKRCAPPVVNAFQRVLLQPALDFHGQLSAVIFRHSFQHGLKYDAFRSLADWLRS